MLYSLHNNVTLFLTCLVHTCVNSMIALFWQLKETTAQAIRVDAHTYVCRGQAASPAAALMLRTPRAPRELEWQTCRCHQDGTKQHMWHMIEGKKTLCIVIRERRSVSYQPLNLAPSLMSWDTADDVM